MTEKMKIIIFYIIFLYIYKLNAEISNYIRQCCTGGSKWAIDNQHCHNYNYGINDIPIVWYGLCLSTFGFCCSKELLKQKCINGQLAAMNHSNCDNGNSKLNSISYTQCCKSCQIGLVVAANGNNCTANEFSYFINDESYMTCCNEINNKNQNQNQNNDKIEHERKLSKPYDNNNAIDECLTEKNACDSNQICTKENGGYRCDCKIGFKMDSKKNACIDINECQINNHNCLESQRCDNTIGSYACIRLKSCGTGYTLNAETGNCDDDDECLLKTHDCPSDYECRNTQGSFRCRKYPKTTTSSTITT